VTIKLTARIAPPRQGLSLVLALCGSAGLGLAADTSVRAWLLPFPNARALCELGSTRREFLAGKPVTVSAATLVHRQRVRSLHGGTKLPLEHDVIPPWNPRQRGRPGKFVSIPGPTARFTAWRRRTIEILLDGTVERVPTSPGFPASNRCEAN